MPREQLANRMICSEGRVDVGKVRRGFLSAQDWSKLTQAASLLGTLPIWIDDSPGLSILELRAKVRRLQAEYDEPAKEGKPAKRIGVVVIDYLQLMRGRENAASREDADNICFIYRDDYYNKEGSTEPNVAELIVAKQRNGPTGTAKVRFDKEWTRFDNLAAGEYMDEEG